MTIDTPATVGTAPPGSPKSTVPGMAKALGRAVIVVATVVLFFAPVPSWGEVWQYDSDGTAWGTTLPGWYALVVLLLGPVITCAVAVLRGQGRWYATPIAPLGALGACLVTGWLLHRLPGAVPDGGDLRSWSVSPLAPLTMLACVMLVLGWLVLTAVALSTRTEESLIRPLWRGRSAVVYCAALAVFAVVGGVVIPWYGTHRGIDATTAAPPPAPSPAQPHAPGTPAWSAAVSGPVLVSGRYLVVPDEDAVSVRDVVTGAERWHYRRSMSPRTQPVVDVSGDGRTVVTMWPTDNDLAVLAGFDLATGRLLWTHAPHGGLFGSTTVVIGVAQVGNTAIAQTHEGNLEGLAVDSGRSRWDWRAPVGCQLIQVQPTPEVLAVFLSCAQDFEVIGIAADGTQRWLWRAPLGPSPLYDGPGGALELVGDTLRMATFDHGDVRVDAATGKPVTPADFTLPTDRQYLILSGRTASGYVAIGRDGTFATNPAGTVLWRHDLPEMAGRYPISAAVVDNTAYVVSVPAGTAGTGAFRLLTLDLVTGAVLGDREVDLPGYCHCGKIALPGGIRLYPAAGAIVLAYATGAQLRLVGYV